MLKVMAIFGTRPEAIKMAPLIKELERTPGIDVYVTVTAQHREMLDMVLDLYDIKPRCDLNVMQKGQTLADITRKTLAGLDTIIAEEKPDLVLVHGDTTTTFSAGLAAFYNRVPVGHVEAGLRTANKYSPFPEEINRRLTGVVADLHFAPTKSAKENLLQENIPEESIFVTGNTVIDALLEIVDKDYVFPQELDSIDFGKRIILVTAHRRENWGEPMENIFLALKDIALKNSSAEIVFPVHKNPLLKEQADRILRGIENIHLINPLDYLPFANLMDRSTIILTDSGGIQEEAPSLGVPVLVMRDATERPEALKAGTVKLVGSNKENITAAVEHLLWDENEYRKIASAVNPYGDGYASGRIAHAILYYFDKSSVIPLEWKAD